FSSRRRHTRFSRDWSSDVCSSDLDGASSPFFMFMPFALLSATLHWRWRGALWTGLICIVALLFLVATDSTAIVDPDVGATTDVSRILFMVVSGILLVWLGAHQEEVRTELDRKSTRLNSS